MGLWKTLARDMGVTSFDVMQRWYSLTYTSSREAATAKAIERRIARFPVVNSGGALVTEKYASSVQRCEQHTNVTECTGYTAEETQLHQWVSSRVKTYNNTNSTLTLSQFWELLATELNQECTFGRVNSLCNMDDRYVPTLLEIYWKRLSCRDEFTALLVPCQPKCISDMNAVVYLACHQQSQRHIKRARDNIVCQSVFAWWNVHLRHKPMDVYYAWDLYIVKKARNIESNNVMCDVESALLSILQAVEECDVGNRVCSQYSTVRSVTRNHDTLSPVVLPNALNLHILISPLPPPLSQSGMSAVSCNSCSVSASSVSNAEPEVADRDYPVLNALDDLYW